VLLSIYLLYKLSKTKNSPVGLNTTILLIVIVIAWETFWTWRNFHNLVSFLPRISDEILSGDFLRSFFVFGNVNIGEKLPLWANIIRFMCWGLLLLSTVIGISKLFRIGKLSFGEKIEIGGLLGVIIISLIGIFSSIEGVQFTRFLMYAPIFCVPIIVSFTAKYVVNFKYVSSLSIVAILVLGVPSFFSSVNTISSDILYFHEIQVGEFLEKHSINQGENLVMYRISDISAGWARFYVMNTMVIDVPPDSYYRARIESYWNDVDTLISSFISSREVPNRIKILILNDKSMVAANHLLGISPNDQRWSYYKQQLQYTNVVYSSGYENIFLKSNLNLVDTTNGIY
jgi:hypothetical protein